MSSVGEWAGAGGQLEEEPVAVAAAPDGGVLVAVGCPEAVVRYDVCGAVVWRAEVDECAVLGWHGSPCLAVVPGGDVAVLGPGELLLLDGATGDRLWVTSLAPLEPAGLAARGDGTIVVFGALGVAADAGGLGLASRADDGRAGFLVELDAEGALIGAYRLSDLVPGLVAATHAGTSPRGDVVLVARDAAGGFAAITFDARWRVVRSVPLPAFRSTPPPRVDAEAVA